MIKYQENRNDIIQRVEIDLVKVTEESRQVLKRICEKYPNIFKFEGRNKFVYETEALIPKVNRDRLKVLMVLGNPAVHSVANGMFFSYERTPTGKRREHRFWRALRELDILKFDSKPEKPTCQNIDKINKYKRDCLLNGDYISNFNIFLLPYFSFPTPASGTCSGVAGIRRIVGKEIFKEMKKFEFQRFEGIVLSNNIKHIICFQQLALEEIEHRKMVDNALKHITLYYAGPTRLLHTNEGKKKLNGIVADIRTKIG